MNSTLLSVAAGGSLVDLDGTLFIQMGIFLFMFAVLYFLLFKPVINLIEARREATVGATTKAEKTLEEARALSAMIDEQLADIRSAVQAERDRMLGQARNTERDLLDRAAEASKKQLQEARREMRKDADDVRASLTKDVDSIAELVASRVLDRAL